MRAQLTALNTEIQTRATAAALAAEIAGTSSNSNAVAPLEGTANNNYDPSQFQSFMDKLNELINALRR